MNAAQYNIKTNMQLQNFQNNMWKKFSLMKITILDLCILQVLLLLRVLHLYSSQVNVNTIPSLFFLHHFLSSVIQ